MRSVFNLFTILFLFSSTVGLQYFQLTVLKHGEQITANRLAALQQSNEEDRLITINRLPAFGFNNLFANGIYLSFVQYFGDKTAREAEGYDLSTLYFSALIERDPRFIDAYLFMTNTLSLYLGQAEQSIALMEKGLVSLEPNIPPRSYYVWRFKAVDELLFLGDGKAAQQSYETSAIWADQSSDKEAPLIAKLSRQTAQFLSQNPVSRAAQISAWTQVLLMGRDERTQQIAAERIESLGGTIVVNAGGQVSVKFNINDEQP